MSGDDSSLLVVTGGVTGQLEDLSSEVLEDSRQVDRGTSTDTFSVVSLAKESVNSTNGELKSRSAGSALALSLCLSSLSAARHDVCLRFGVSDNSENIVLKSWVLRKEQNPFLYGLGGFQGPLLRVYCFPGA